MNDEMGSAEQTPRPEPAPTRESLLTEADVLLLADAIRQGTSRPPQPARTLVLALLVAAGVLAGGSFFVNWALESHPSERLTASTLDLSPVHSIAARGAVGDVSWHIQHGFAARLEISDASAPVFVSLPAEPETCSGLATKLRGECSAGTLSLVPPVVFDWSAPIRFTTLVPDSAPKYSRITLGVNSVDGALGSLDVLLSREGSPSICFTPPVDNATLVVTSGNGRSESIALTGAGARCDALRIAVSSNGSAELTSLVFVEVPEIELGISGPTLEVDSLSGKVSLADTTSRVLDPAQHIVFSTGADSIAAALSVSQIGGRLSIGPSPAVSVLTDEGEMVPSRWVGMQQFALPILLALFAALVWPAVSAGTQRVVGLLGGHDR